VKEQEKKETDAGIKTIPKEIHKHVDGMMNFLHVIRSHWIKMKAEK